MNQGCFTGGCSTCPMAEREALLSARFAALRWMPMQDDLCNELSAFLDSHALPRDLLPMLQRYYLPLAERLRACIRKVQKNPSRWVSTVLRVAVNPRLQLFLPLYAGSASAGGLPCFPWMICIWVGWLVRNW